jgi:uncharacterized protein YdeI (YjbR/CyaY-like superfamily)
MIKLFFKNRKEWREWLEKNHSTSSEAWLVYYKKHTGKKSIPYDDAVEESICFGWIDGKVRRIDDEKYMQRYTPRRESSVWSLSNKNRVRKMIKAGRMTPAGMKLVRAAKKSGKWDAAYSSKKDFEMPADLVKALKAYGQAWKNFSKFAKGYKYSYVTWVNWAKTKETRERRIKKVVERCAKNKKPGEM